MIYALIYSNDRKEVEKLEGEFLEFVPAKDLEDITKVAKRRLQDYGFKCCSIFSFDIWGMMSLKILDLEEEVFKTLSRWFK